MRTRLAFYLPNFEDLVDPGYDFVHDRTSSNRRDRFADDRYPHELFDEPIFDGLLMSKTVIKPGIEARIRREGGIHAFLRLEERFPVMGDCGAFSYRDQEEPPYTTAEILDYYESLGFTYGVSMGEPSDETLTQALRDAPKIIREHGQRLELAARGLPAGPLLDSAVQLYERLVRRAIEGTEKRSFQRPQRGAAPSAVPRVALPPLRWYNDVSRVS